MRQLWKVAPRPLSDYGVVVVVVVLVVDVVVVLVGEGAGKVPINDPLTRFISVSDPVDEPGVGLLAPLRLATQRSLPDTAP